MVDSKDTSFHRRNRKLACHIWNLKPNNPLLITLKQLSQEFGLSVLAGHLILLQTHWYVTHAGLLNIAQRNRCRGIQTQFVPGLSDTISRRFAFKATVFNMEPVKVSLGTAMRTHPMFRLSPWRGDASCGDPRRQSRFAESLRNRHLLSRGNRILPWAWRASSVFEKDSAAAGQWELPPNRSTRKRSPLPNYPPASARSWSREVLRRRVLRHKGSARCHARAGRKLCGSFG